MLLELTKQQKQQQQQQQQQQQRLEQRTDTTFEEKTIPIMHSLQDLALRESIQTEQNVCSSPC